MKTIETDGNRLAEQSFLRLHNYLVGNDYMGYEFDDILGSKIVRTMCANNLLLKRVAVQVGKRSPLNIRPFVGVKKLASTKANGFFAKAYLTQYAASKEEQWLQCALNKLQWLLDNHSEGYSGLSWGNSFEFASRGGSFQKGMPTVVWSAHIADAFDLAYAITRDPLYEDAVGRVCQFIMHDLERKEDEHGICIAYAPGIIEPIHNSNLLAASTLLRGWRSTGDKTILEVAKRAYAWTAHYQNSDGSFYYGVGDKYHWIDNFHTAYNVDRLLIGYELGGESVVPFSIVQTTFEYWTKTFFLKDGTPKFYHNRVFPIDIQCAAQAIETLSKCHSLFPQSRHLNDKLVTWTIGHMQKRNGSFLYQMRPFWKNRLESIHWGQSTMLAALAHYRAAAV